MRRLPLVSIIIINWNGGEVLRNCLKSLAKLNYSNWELIVVDNGSSDGSVEAVRKFEIRNSNIEIIENEKNVGFAGGNNQGYKRAKGEYVLLLNNDTVVTPNFLKLLVERMEKEKSVGVVQPKIMMMDKKGYLDNAGAFLTRTGFLKHWGFGKRDGKEFSKEREIFSAKGACMLVRREVIKKIGLFDGDFFSYFEESDFCWRVWLLGYKVLFYPEAKIEHKVGYTIKRLDVSGNNYHYYKNRICSMAKNLGIVNLVVILPFHLLISLGVGAAFLVYGQPRSSWLIMRAMGWNIINIRKTVGKRIKIQKMRKVSDRELFRKLMVKAEMSSFLADFVRVKKDLEEKNK